MNTSRTTTLRGLTLIELLLSLTITLVIGMAMTGVISAVVSGVDVRRDNRAHIVRAYAAQSRLLSYIAPSRCFLATNHDLVVLWFNDSRESQTVHGTEVRWLEYDAGAQTIVAHYVKFPDEWSAVNKWLTDAEHPVNSDWRAVLEFYQSAGCVESVVLVDGISVMRVLADNNRPVNARSAVIRLDFANEGNTMTIKINGTLRERIPPSR